MHSTPQHFETLHSGRSSLRLESESETEENKIACSGKSNSRKTDSKSPKETSFGCGGWCWRSCCWSSDSAIQEIGHHQLQHVCLSLCLWQAKPRSRWQKERQNNVWKNWWVPAPAPSSPNASLKADWSCMSWSPNGRRKGRTSCESTDDSSSTVTLTPKGPFKKPIGLAWLGLHETTCDGVCECDIFSQT